MQQMAKVFELKPNALNVRVGVVLAVILFLLGVVLAALGAPQYWLSLAFGLLFAASSDPGGDRPYSSRVPWFGGVAIVGALLTALGFALGGGTWVWAALTVFLITLLSGFAAAYGKQAAQAAYLLTIWFIIVLALPYSYARIPWPAQAWPQALAWLAGGALCIVLTFVVSLRRRERQPSPVEPPQQTPPPEAQQQKAPVQLSRPLIVFSVLRALAAAVTVGIAWGFKLPHADWMPVAALVVMKPGLDESLLVAEQRVAGAILGALLAAGFLTVVHDKHLLAVLILVFGALAGAVHAVNYAIYCTCVAAAVLIALGVGEPGNLSANWERVGWTLAGVAIGLGVIVLAGLARKGLQQVSHGRNPSVAPA
jgi:hypothetical protein